MVRCAQCGMDKGHAHDCPQQKPGKDWSALMVSARRTGDRVSHGGTMRGVRLNRNPEQVGRPHA